MSEKVTMQDIIELLAEKHSMAKKDAEFFVKGMFELIEEALATEKYVKVKGLGVFKLTEVEKRGSVNVNTGERFEIQGHTKVSFTPDSSMKDLINKPFAHFETVILNEGTKLEDTEAEMEGEEEGTFDENVPKQTVVIEEVEPIETEKAGDSPNEHHIVAENTIPVIEETIIEEPAPSAEITEEKIQIIEPEEIPEKIVIEAENKVSNPPEKEEVITIADAAMLAAREAGERKIEETAEVEDVSREKNSKALWRVLFAIILIVCIVGSIYCYLQSDKTLDLQSPATIKNTQEQLEKVIPAIPDNDSLMQGKDTASILMNISEKDTINQLQQAVPATTIKSSDMVTTQNAAKETLADTVEYDITGTKTNYILQEGESLVKLAMKFYGTKKLWPYIVKHNKNIIKDADRVPIGTTLRIPELTPKK